LATKKREAAKGTKGFLGEKMGQSAASPHLDCMLQHIASRGQQLWDMVTEFVRLYYSVGFDKTGWGEAGIVSAQRGCTPKKNPPRWWELEGDLSFNLFLGAGLCILGTVHTQNF
jgi:hypothetical protein